MPVNKAATCARYRTSQAKNFGISTVAEMNSVSWIASSASSKAVRGIRKYVTYPLVWRLTATGFTFMSVGSSADEIDNVDPAPPATCKY